MVALSFKGQFEAPIKAGTKRQTIRAGRKRPPRAGERLQLYCGMRTKHCRKIVPDPLCSEVCLVRIVIDPQHQELIEAVNVDGYELDARGIERFAVADGFAAQPAGSARRAMGNFWMRHHGPGEFIGLLIRWEPE